MPATPGKPLIFRGRHRGRSPVSASLRRPATGREVVVGKRKKRHESPWICNLNRQQAGSVSFFRTSARRRERNSGDAVPGAAFAHHQRGPAFHASLFQALDRQLRPGLVGHWPDHDQRCVERYPEHHRFSRRRVERLFAAGDHGTSLVRDVNANQTNPNTFTTGGVTEFHIANPTIALAGSGTAKAPTLCSISMPPGARTWCSASLHAILTAAATMRSSRSRSSIGSATAACGSTFPPAISPMPALAPIWRRSRRA